MLNEVSGERMLVVFGIPLTHEDDVRRALLAAMDLHGMTELTGDTSQETMHRRLGREPGARNPVRSPR